MEWLSRNIDHPLLFILAITISLPVLKQYWKWVFGDTSNFVSDVKDAAMPDWYAFFRGRYWESEWAELKIGFFIILCISCVAAAYKLGVTVFYE